MLLKLPKPLVSWIILCGILSGCNGNQTAEGIFRPDPELQTPTPEVTQELTIPQDFPPTIPIYPEAQIKAIAPNTGATQGQITWESTDPVNLIQSYYQAELSAADWTLSTNESDYNFLATKDNLKVQLSLNPSSPLTEIIIAYQTSEDNQSQTPPPSPTTVISDLADIPPKHQQYVQDLAQLGVFGDSDWGSNQTFAPNRVITRREYARWLLSAHNLLYSDTPSQQISSVSQATQPAFEDIPLTDSDFSIIQGLAEAGIIPSRLTGDSNALKFLPDTPLTREDLITWKVPLDYRKALPPVSIEDIRETWGFQDVNIIDPRVRQALYIDEQNSDRSNVRRAFGYTTLFQPNKPVTRSEAAAVLWYFGYQNQGISAAEFNSRG
ncbi:S-layer homology domain-containing protein [Gloeocapsa sp. PCC 73106]|uniref:S-layer homology domain-containing protein n=1 Tax=Gloeocapsa sp. PCC 73106 TaxID=102232 RepID=UPI0002AD0D08|nr:S-layer homology domain-containing protein [Gloeocapsa sp. PCC 73106]ELR96258.1 putative S-layer protein [Gloeocapsa sp. PCC 73106]